MNKNVEWKYIILGLILDLVGVITIFFSKNDVNTILTGGLLIIMGIFMMSIDSK